MASNNVSSTVLCTSVLKLVGFCWTVGRIPPFQFFICLLNFGSFLWVRAPPKEIFFLWNLILNGLFIYYNTYLLGVCLWSELKNLKPTSRRKIHTKIATAFYLKIHWFIKYFINWTFNKCLWCNVSTFGFWSTGCGFESRASHIFYFLFFSQKEQKIE